MWGLFLFSFAGSIGTRKHIIDAYAVHGNRVVSGKEKKSTPKAITHSLSSVGVNNNIKKRTQRERG
jgi:hypothetical protein